MYNRLPHWIMHYQRKGQPGDLIAGLVVKIILISQGIAYALIGQMPPQPGLYTRSAESSDPCFTG